MHRTPWTSSGSLTSDRIPARPLPAKQQAKGKGQGPPKSKAVSALETRLHNVEYASGKEKDPKGGCFCLARDHDLSTYVPLCYGCGLVLCNLNLPHYACPHCGESFLDNSRRPALVAQIQEELRMQVVKEDEERQRAIVEARKAEGAFPMLPGAGGTQGARKGTAAGPQASHKVMSLNNTTKKVTVSSYTNTPVSSRPPSPTPEEPHRIPPPPKEISYVKQPPDPAHPWKNMQFPDLQYVPPPKDPITHDKQQQKKGRGQ
ncbi:hypothetical protein BKA82DRAFT_132754 [Pisolithus tinctorius]|uniref:TRIP4/RQT4 C2HC5-type zinc finger domain-containing protein n=1 Tax=Pisolithus tinctorius Marx 270 TaxID=870435 RepID=A0A0C3PKU4_PISTI|nr:hypothetical protein BKA82DRAFT_132754 [Pisolithus tinctorius]KIO09301.1 hypothetical protein M404DRAFT_132754 [Pisolithus tinctorius Marx 270]